MSSPSGLARRFSAHVAERGWLADGDTVLVALSGGLDSTVLLHLLRFHSPRPGLRLHAVHVDHAMREGSAVDGRFVRGLCSAWGVDLELRRLAKSPRSEGQARDSRYPIFEEVRGRTGARWVVTAHHADDQAETVLFRAARGTGIRGLAGIPETRAPGLLRPLLPFHRSELALYAGENRIRPRVDPSNQDLEVPRNHLRHRVIPGLERFVAPGAGKALARLAAHVRNLETALQQWTTVVEGAATPDEDHGPTSGDAGSERPGKKGKEAVLWNRDRLLEMPAELRSILVRSVFDRFGERLDEAGTRSVIEFTSNCSSGSRIRVGAVEVRREFETFVVGPGRVSSADSSLTVDSPGAGVGEIRIGGRRYVAHWSTQTPPVCAHVDSFPHDLVPFPLEIRSWRPGDRIRMTYGTKKLVKLFAEKRVGSDARRRIPLLVDAEGKVLWAPGVARANVPQGPGNRPMLHVGIDEAKENR